jgi:hypothetical protein
VKRRKGSKWSKEHDMMLKSMRERGLSWETITESFPGRDVPSCQQRYSKIKEGEKSVLVTWSKEHSLLLTKLKEKGVTWEEISKSFPGRDVISCKNRYSLIKEGEKRACVSWSKEHSSLLKKLNEKGSSWEELSKSFPGRDAQSCRNRYQNHIYEGEKQVQVPWSKEQVSLLKKLKNKGLSWEMILKSFPGRTAA